MKMRTAARPKGKLDQMSAHLEGIQHRSYIRHGQVWKGLAGIINENQIDLVVSRNAWPLRARCCCWVPLAEDILRHSPYPVLTVGPKVSRAGPAALETRCQWTRSRASGIGVGRHILFATDFSQYAVYAANEAVALAADSPRAPDLCCMMMEDYTELGSAGPI